MEKLQLDSKEEEYFLWYLEELKQHGFIDEYVYQPKVFRITDPLIAKQLIVGKRSSKVKEVSLLREHEYRADYLIRWNRKGHDLFYVLLSNLLSGELQKRFSDFPFIANEKNGRHFSVIDVKGTYNQNDAYRRFSIDQKLVMEKYKIYVQKIITHPAITKGKLSHPNALFVKTFVPERFLFTDKKTKKRVINYEYKSINQYINQTKHGT